MHALPEVRLRRDRINWEMVRRYLRLEGKNWSETDVETGIATIKSTKNGIAGAKRVTRAYRRNHRNCVHPCGVDCSLVLDSVTV